MEIFTEYNNTIKTIILYLTMRFLKLLKSHRQILTPSPTKPVTDAKHERINRNYFHEFVPNRNQHSTVEEIGNILAIK